MQVKKKSKKDIEKLERERRQDRIKRLQKEIIKEIPLPDTIKVNWSV